MEAWQIGTFQNYILLAQKIVLNCYFLIIFQLEPTIKKKNNKIILHVQQNFHLNGNQWDPNHNITKHNGHFTWWPIWMSTGISRANRATKSFNEKIKELLHTPTNYCTQKPWHSILCLNNNERFYSINAVLYSNNTLKFLAWLSYTQWQFPLYSTNCLTTKHDQL